MSEPDKDPVVHSSLSKPLLIFSALLVLSLVWALWDEAYGERPWKTYQRKFVNAYSRYLRDAKRVEAANEAQIKASAEYRRLDEAAREAEQRVLPEIRKIDDEINRRLTPQILALNDAFQVLRSEAGALTYELETSSSAGRKNSLQGRIGKVKARVVQVELPQPDGTAARKRFSYDQMDDLLKQMRARKAELQQQRVDLLKPSAGLRAQRDQYLTDHVADTSLETLSGIQRGLERFTVQIRQIHVKDVEMVERCESCHLGIREPVVLTKADMGGEGAFTSHPNPDLLKIHDPEQFGCTPCHNGNGIAVDSVEKAHGHYEHWLWPMYAKANFEAGCQQCHSQEILTQMAPVLNEGREVFRRRGCMGCHRYEGFNREPEELQGANRKIRDLEQQRAELERQIGFTIQKGDKATDNATAQKLYAQADTMKLQISDINGQVEQLDMRSKSLLQEIKKVGPDLKEVRMKLRKEWIPVWLQDPHRWRPGTKMPTFRLSQDQIQAIAAFIWQSGIEGELPKNPPGDAARGKEAFETRGCMACHSMGEGAEQEGGDFAANLSRVGEKANYDYLVRWVHNPRDRTLPYCTLEKKDLTAEDYKKHGLPFVFDMDHTKCPNDGHELVVEQMTPMPSLRLTIEEARDIATYLISRKHDNTSYPPADYMDDPKLKAKGEFLVRYYGCAGCHEIRGLEEEQRIGTELTREGSKPIERLDFALFTVKAEREGWYDQKGFFEHKLKDPAVFDQGKEKPDPLERLKMPNFNLSPEEVTAVTTFLLGSVDSTLPPRYFYAPSDQKQDIIEGWWVVRKYNCMGCHRVMAGQQAVFDKLRRYQDPDWKDQKPPSLIGEGGRVNPDWLMAFLSNPAMSTTDTNRDGVRGYLKARMPTFYFSPGEIRKLVRFFAALSSQAQPYIAQKLEPLTDQERVMARQLFTSEGAPCLKCHMTGDPSHDRTATAPNFLQAKERLKPGWARRWMLDPAMMAPGTAMPSGLFRKETDRYVFAGPVPASFQGYTKDHAELLVRYMFQFTPEEMNKLRSATKTQAAAGRPPLAASLH